jgi:hypothetical protein
MFTFHSHLGWGVVIYSNSELTHPTKHPHTKFENKYVETPKIRMSSSDAHASGVMPHFLAFRLTKFEHQGPVAQSELVSVRANASVKISLTLALNIFGLLNQR